MAGSRFNGNYISFFQFNLVAVSKISLPGIFELHFHHVTLFRIARNVRQPIVGVQLFILSGASFAAKATASIMKFIFHKFIYLLLLQQYNHLQREVEEYHFSIYILFYM